MSRDEGFTRADVDTGLYADPKIVALARRLRDPVSTAAHVALYEALVLESWAAGDRVAFGDALPAWWLEPATEQLGNLTAVGLVDADGRLPEHAWETWFRPAFDRRESYRARGQKGGRPPSAKPERKPSQTTAEPRTGPSGPNPSGPSGPNPLRSGSGAPGGARKIEVDDVE